MKILDEAGAALTSLQRILIVGDGTALGRGERLDTFVIGDLMQFATASTKQFLIVDRDGLQRSGSCLQVRIYAPCAYFLLFGCRSSGFETKKGPIRARVLFSVRPPRTRSGRSRRRWQG
jgi:hypothetical protein